MPKAGKKEDKKKFNISQLLIKQFKKAAIGLAVVVIAVSYWFIIKPEREKVDAVYSKEIAPLETDVETKSQQVESLRKRTKDFEVIKYQRFQSLEEILPYNNNTKEDLFLILYQIMEEEGVSIKTLNFGRPISIAAFAAKGNLKVFANNFALLNIPVTVVPITIELVEQDGNIGYSQVKQIIANLVKKRRIFNIGTLEVSAQNKENSEGVTENKESSLKLNFNTYLLDQTQVLE